jgi:hypothetical protein
MAAIVSNETCSVSEVGGPVWVGKSHHATPAAGHKQSVVSESLQSALTIPSSR